MRGIIIKFLKRNKKKFKEKKIQFKELLRFEEVFICNSIFGIWPVVKILKKKFVFGDKTKEIINILSKIKI